VKVSVVIASGAGGEFLFRCLGSLRAEATASGAETIVVDRIGGETAERVLREHPWVRLLPAESPESPGRASVPELRRRGALAATGEVVAVIEEHCTAPAGWIAAIASAFEAAEGSQPPLLAIGGPILHADFDRVRDWVVYFSEYHNFLPPWPAAPRALLNGANIAYRRSALLAHEKELASGYWEVVLHPRLAAEGRLLAVPAMGARHTGPFDYGYYLEQRYLLSRVWGGTQRGSAGVGKRLAYLVLAPLFPFLLLARIAARVLASKGLFGRFLVALPLLVPVAVAYVWGEWLGYLLGPGDALERVE
jgi:hypothetical protein